MYSIPPFSSGTTDPFHDLDGEPGHGSCTSLGNFLRGRRCSELSQASDCEDPRSEALRCTKLGANCDLSVLRLAPQKVNVLDSLQQTVLNLKTCIFVHVGQPAELLELR